MIKVSIQIEYGQTGRGISDNENVIKIIEKCKDSACEVVSNIKQEEE